MAQLLINEEALLSAIRDIMLAEEQKRPARAKDGRHSKPELRLGRGGLPLPVGLQPGGAGTGEERGGEEEAELLRGERAGPRGELRKHRLDRLAQPAHLQGHLQHGSCAALKW